MNRRHFLSTIASSALMTRAYARSFNWPCVSDADGVSEELAITHKGIAPPNSHDLLGVGAFRLEWLPFQRKGMQTHQFCSYDRAGDNYDAEYLALYTEADGQCV